MAKKDVSKAAVALHKKLGGKIRIAPAMLVKNRAELSLIYTPGVAAVSSLITKTSSYIKQAKLAGDYTIKGRMIAVVSDGSAVLGLGNIGPYGALPVMEGKCALFKSFAGVDAFPITLDLTSPRLRQASTREKNDFIVETICAIAPAFGGINLEDIAAPNCFYIEEELKKRLNIPVFHDDQHGTAIVVLAALMNAMKVVKKDINRSDKKIAVSGVGAAGVAIMKLIKQYAPKVKIIAVDSVGIVSTHRHDLNDVKKKLLEDRLIVGEESGDLAKALIDADVFIGVSKPGVLTGTMIKEMAQKPVIFAMANPTPEIMPTEALRAGAAVVGTGRSDFPNQINNSLAFPGVFRGALDNKVSKITDEMKIKAAKNLAALVKKPTAHKIVPGPFEKGIAQAVAKAIK